ncbi:MAG TPA: type II toxin-antitoxin system VapC family toxin [Thermoguttaceae bacterium]|nr:type II toxin-antitoxin system VapC family toxin [Thermoguttaceae bacterium]
MRPKVYIETTVVSYLSAWRSPELVMAAQQEATRNWWDEQRERFDLYVSEAVIVEASAGDVGAAKRRLEVVEGIPELEITDEARDLAKRLVADIPLPEKAQLDALHIALATVNAMDYLLTWNCRHIANAALRHRIEAVCDSAGYETPVICTPPELIED